MVRFFSMGTFLNLVQLLDTGQLIDPDVQLPLGNGDSVKKQIRKGCRAGNIDLLNPISWITPLQYVIVSNRTTDEKLKLINILLANGANPLGPDQDGKDALYYAVASDNPDIEVIERLVKAGAQADIPNGDGSTCMHLVSDIKNHQMRQDIAKILIRCNPNMNVVDQFENTPLLNAVKQGRVELVKLFLSKTQAKIDQTDSKGNSILMLAMLKAAEKWMILT